MRRVFAIAVVLATACGPETNEDEENTDTDGACEPGTEPAGEIVWSADGSGVDSFAGLAALPDGGVVAVGSREGGGGRNDAVVVAFTADGATAWDVEYDGLAGLSDDGLDVAVGDDGEVVVLVREVVDEDTSEFGPVVDARLVRLTFVGDPPGEPERVEWERPDAPPMSEYSPFGALAIVDGETMIVGWSGLEMPAVLRVDAEGSVIGETMLALPAESHVNGARVGANGRVFLSGDSNAGGPDDVGWIGAYETDGALAWSLLIEGENIENVVTAPEPSGGVFAYWGGELGTGTGGASIGRIIASGEIAWSKPVETAGADGYTGRLAVPCAGGFALAVGTGAQIVVSRFDDDGNEGWSSTLEMSATVHDVVAIASGDLVVSASGTLTRVRAGG